MLSMGLKNLHNALMSGVTRSIDLVAESMARIADENGEGASTFTKVFLDTVRAEARQADLLYAQGRGADMPLLGIPISIKDLFDVRGQITTAGSIILQDAAPAVTDARIVSRLREAGAVIIGRTNMTELAFSGLGLNPHYGTPLNPWDRSTGRIPGGSSSGAAVSVADGMCAAAIGSDTGGSVRIPAALCGLTGFKPTQRLVPREGMYPLSKTLDSIGPIARSVDDCSLLFDILSNSQSSNTVDCSRPKLAIPTNYLLEDLDSTVAEGFEAALLILKDAGFVLDRIAVAGFDSLSDAARLGSFPGIEAFSAHRELLRNKAQQFDPRVRNRIEAAGLLAPGTLARLHGLRAKITAEIATTFSAYDGFIFPTVPIIAPSLESMDDDEQFSQINALLLRNPTVVNFVDGCAVSLPISARGGAPVGLSIAGPHGSDRRILAIARVIEGHLNVSFH